jgi:malonyl CoA-acyl carrier protein transacylase
MTPTQREAAERLIKARKVLFTHKAVVEWADHAETLLRELAAEPVQKPVAWMAESKSGTARFTNIGQSADELESLGWASCRSTPHRSSAPS